MKTKIIIIILILLAVMLIAFSFFQPATGPHNGIVKPAGDYNIEMKNNNSNFYTYLLDKKNEPISNKGVSCYVRFIFYDYTGINLSLDPYGEDGFILTSVAPNFLSCRIHYNVLGRSISANFENEIPIAKRK